MIAHNNDRERDIFQIAPAPAPQSLWLAEQAHLANEIWNASAPVVEPAAGARAAWPRASAAPTADVIPAPAAHLALRGEVRPPYDPRSTLYNTDGQIFSDAGVPVRAVHGELRHQPHRLPRHARHDGEHRPGLRRGVAAIAIESVARAACEKT